MQVRFGNVPTPGVVVETAPNGMRGGHNPQYFYMVKDTADRAYGLNVTQFVKNADGTYEGPSESGYGYDKFNVVA